MATPDDFELQRAPRLGQHVTGSGGGPPLVPMALVAGLVAAVIGGGWWWMSRAPKVPPASAGSGAVLATDAPVAPAAAPVAALPPLEGMDPFLRQLLGALSTRPELARWLATDGLIQQLAAAIEVAAQGRSPARDLKVLKPTGAFATVRRGRTRAIDPATYKRYDGLAATITSIDASAAAKVYKTIQPRLNEAYRNQGRPGGSVDQALAEALRILIDTPVLKDPVTVVEGKGARWAYDDPGVESLTSSQKQLLRMGPANVEKILVWLRAFQQQL